MAQRTYYWCKDLDVFPPPSRRILEQVAENEANLIGSLCDDGMHRPVLDIDVGSRVNAGFFVIDAKMNWEQFQKLNVMFTKLFNTPLFHHPLGLSGLNQFSFPGNFCSAPALRIDKDRGAPALDDNGRIVNIQIAEKIYFHSSSTPGHGHLYIDHPIKWLDYVELMTLMAKIGMIEQAYADHSISQGMSFVRPPWVKKKISRAEWAQKINEFMESGFDISEAYRYAKVEFKDRIVEDPKF